MSADTSLEAVIYRHDLSRHTVNLKVDGTYAYSDKDQVGFFINPHIHVGEIKVPFRKTLFFAGMFILAVIPIYIGLMSALLPLIDLYKVLLAVAVSAVPIGGIILFRIAAPTVKRRIFCIWGEPEPINLYDVYDWDYDLHWARVSNLHAVAKGTARFSTMRGQASSMLVNSVAWLILGAGVLIALVIVVGLLRPGTVPPA